MFNGRKAREIREEIGLTQEQLGEKVGLTKQSISLVELGREPTLELAAMIATSLNCKLDELLK